MNENDKKFWEEIQNFSKEEIEELIKALYYVADFLMEDFPNIYTEFAIANQIDVHIREKTIKFFQELSAKLYKRAIDLWDYLEQKNVIN